MHDYFFNNYIELRGVLMIEYLELQQLLSHINPLWWQPEAGIVKNSGVFEGVDGGII